MEYDSYIIDTVFRIYDSNTKELLKNYLDENNIDLEDLLNDLLNDFLLGELLEYSRKKNNDD